MYCNAMERLWSQMLMKYLFRRDIDIWYVAILTHDGQMRDDINWRDVTSNDADPA